MTAKDTRIEIGKITKAGEGVFVTHCPGDGTFYSFFITEAIEHGEKVIYVFPCGDGATLNEWQAISESNTPVLEKIKTEPGSSEENKNTLKERYPDFRECFGENPWTFAEVLMLAKRALLRTGELSEIVK